MNDYINNRTKLEVGSNVRVKDDLQVGKRYYSETGVVGNVFTPHMEHNRGKVAEVIAVRDGQYILNIDRVNLYTYQMLVDLATEDDPSFVKQEYVFNKQVEALLNKLMKEQAYDAMDKALEERLFETDPVKFEEIKALLQS